MYYSQVSGLLFLKSYRTLSINQSEKTHHSHMRHFSYSIRSIGHIILHVEIFLNMAIGGDRVTCMSIAALQCKETDPIHDQESDREA